MPLVVRRALYWLSSVLRFCTLTYPRSVGLPEQMSGGLGDAEEAACRRRGFLSFVGVPQRRRRMVGVWAWRGLVCLQLASLYCTGFSTVSSVLWTAVKIIVDRRGSRYTSHVVP